MNVISSCRFKKMNRNLSSSIIFTFYLFCEVKFNTSFYIQNKLPSQRMKYRFYLSSLFIIVQVGLIIYARFIPERFFCWAPYDTHVRFEVSVKINDSIYRHKELEDRYHYHMKGWEQRSIHNVLSLIEQYEKTYGKMDNAEVEMIYSINGHKEEKWTYKN